MSSAPASLFASPARREDFLVVQTKQGDQKRTKTCHEARLPGEQGMNRFQESTGNVLFVTIVVAIFFSLDATPSGLIL